MADGLLNLIDDELLRRGVIPPAAVTAEVDPKAVPLAFPALPEGPQELRLMMVGIQVAILVSMIRESLVDAETEADVVDAFDRLVELGVPTQFDAVTQLAMSFPTDLVDGVHDELAEQARGEDEETAAVIREAVSLQQTMLQSVRAHLALGSPQKPSATGALDRPRYAANLALLPVPIAKLHLRAQRSILASSMVVDAVSPPRTEQPAWLVRAVAEVWRDGIRAQAAMLASLFPDWPVAQQVPPEDLLDFAAIVREQLRIDARMDDLLDQLPEGVSAPFHAPSR